ncbi:MAG: response regulator transcription factor [Limnobacter sp.]|nr:response regulator transcription factor [Limnobacter sp.]
MNVLIIEDDPRVSSFLERGLKAEGYRVRLAVNAAEGIAFAKELAKELQTEKDKAVILLDVMLPDQSGLTVCQTLRSSGIHIPILMLTALSSLEDRINGLRLGADDYLPKPFAFEEVLARIEALGRRSITPAINHRSSLKVDDLEMDLETMKVTRAGKRIDLTAKELALLELLMSSPGRLFSRERILANVWGTNEDPLTNVVDVYVRRLRNKIDLEGLQPLIHTQRGLGYRLELLTS